MVINREKTEIMYIPRAHSSLKELAFGNLKSIKQMKVLGITMDYSLSWSPHIATTLNKLARMTGALKFLRNCLTKQQFLTVITSQYYGICYYASQAWLGPHTRKMDLRKLNSMNYKLLRIASRDWRNKAKKVELDKMGRACPSVWAKYATASFTIKAIRDGVPTRLNNHINQTLNYERRFPKMLRFYDSSRKRVGKQALCNRLKSIFDDIKVKLTWQESNDTIRRMLKKSLNFVGQHQ